MADWMRCVESGANYEAEYRLRSKDGDYRWFRARAVPIRDPDGKIIKWYGTCSDIHDSKLLEQSIRDNATELEKMVDRRTDELRRLSIRLMTMQDQERRRIARDLHDGLGQELAVAKMVLDKMILQNANPLNRPKKRGLRPAALLIARFSKSAPCLTFCIRPCSMKSACCPRLPGTLKDSPSGAASKRLSTSSPAIFPGWRRR